MPIRPEHDDLIVEEAKKVSHLTPREIARIARRAGHEFYSSEYTWGWQTGRRLVALGRLKKTGPGMYAYDDGKEVWLGVPELGEVGEDRLKRIKACFLLAMREMGAAEHYASGTLKEWLQMAQVDCERRAAYLDMILEEDLPCADSQSSS